MADSFSSALTSGIINTVCTDCGHIEENSYEQDFSADDLLDPEFPITNSDSNSNVTEYISSYLGILIEEIVSILKEMENCFKDGSIIKDKRRHKIAMNIWSMGKDVSIQRVSNLYGYDSAQEFNDMGTYFFG